MGQSFLARLFYPLPKIIAAQSLVLDLTQRESPNASFEPKMSRPKTRRV